MNFNLTFFKIEILNGLVVWCLVPVYEYTTLTLPCLVNFWLDFWFCGVAGGR